MCTDRFFLDFPTAVLDNPGVNGNVDKSDPCILFLEHDYKMIPSNCE